MTNPRFVQRAPRRRKWQWKHPWSILARRSKRFREFCWGNGYVSPNFSRPEWACHDGTPLPPSLRRGAQRQAFQLERFRHALGDVSLPLLSAYRTREYNTQIGGASQSRHIEGDATDFSNETINRIGRPRFFGTAERIWSNGGVGNYPSGSGHTDSRGYRARWSSF